MSLLSLIKTSELLQKISSTQLLRRAVTQTGAVIPSLAPEAKVLRYYAGPQLSKADVVARTVVKRAPLEEMGKERLALSNKMIEELPLPTSLRNQATRVEKTPSVLPKVGLKKTPITPKPPPPSGPQVDEKNIPTSILNRRNVLVAGGVGGGVGYASIDPQKVAGLVNMALSGGKALAKGSVGGPLRRKVTGSALLVGGMGGYGATRGVGRASYGLPMK